jgi:hypothetical protein
MSACDFARGRYPSSLTDIRQMNVVWPKFAPRWWLWQAPRRYPERRFARVEGSRFEPASASDPATSNVLSTLQRRSAFGLCSDSHWSHQFTLIDSVTTTVLLAHECRLWVESRNSNRPAIGGNRRFPEPPISPNFSSHEPPLRHAGARHAMKPATAASARRVQSALGPDYHVLEFDAGTGTAVDAPAAIGRAVAEIAKSLIFRAEPSGARRAGDRTGRRRRRLRVGGRGIASRDKESGGDRENLRAEGRRWVASNCGNGGKAARERAEICSYDLQRLGA